MVVRSMGDTVDEAGNAPVGDDSRKDSWLVARGALLEPGPRRIIAIASFVNMLGTSMFSVSAAIFYTQVVGLSVAQVGLGMGVGALVGMLAGVPIGRLADQRGPREVYLLTLTVQAISMAALVLVRSFWLFVVLISLSALAQAASQAARAPIVRRFAGEKPTKFRAYLRSAANLAGSLGALFAGLVIQLNTHSIYVVLIVGNAASFLVSAAVISRLPRMDPLAAPAGAKRRPVLKDYPFVAVTALNGIMSIQAKVLSFALPLWIVSQTHAPRWFVGVSVLVNTVMVVTLQVRSSRGVETNEGAVRVWRRAGFAFLAGLGLMGLTAGVPGWAATLLIVAGVVIYTVGELWQTAGSFELRYNLAPAHAQGQYTGVFLMGSSIAGVVAPSVLGLLCLTWGAPGWWAMGAVFAVVGLAIPPVVRWAERTRPDTTAAVEVAS